MTTNLQVSAQKQLRQLIEQIERLSEERTAIGADITDKFKEAKGLGFDPKVMKRILQLRKKSQGERDEEDALIATYLQALGMAGTPMGDYMAEQDASREMVA